jgi:TRAP-type C4-dicarboxylate transport system substrate-binding protein
VAGTGVSIARASRHQSVSAERFGSDLQALSALQGGTVDITVLNAGLLSGIVKDFAVVDLPFMFNEAKEGDAVVDGLVGQKTIRQRG